MMLARVAERPNVYNSGDPDMSQLRAAERLPDFEMLRLRSCEFFALLSP